MKKLIGIIALASLSLTGLQAMQTMRTKIPVGMYCVDLNPRSAVGARTAWAKSGQATNIREFKTPELPIIDVETGEISTVNKPRLRVTKNGRTYDCFFFDASSGQGMIRGTQKQANKSVFSWEIRNNMNVQGIDTVTLYLAPFYTFVGTLNGNLGLQFVLDISSLQGKTEITEQDIANLLDVRHVAQQGKESDGKHTFTFKPLIITPQVVRILPVNDQGMQNLNPAMMPVKQTNRR